MDETEMLRRSRQLRQSMTKEENRLWFQFLRKYPLQFKRQYIIGNYIVDFYCYKARLIVELDGSQHCDPRDMEYDHKRTQFLKNQGYQVLRISNLDVLRQFSAVCSHIDRIARQRVECFDG